MRNFVLWAITTFRRENNIQCLFLNFNFTIFKNKKPMLFIFLTTTLSQLGLTSFNSMLALLAI
jgi:hypothetical protein